MTSRLYFRWSKCSLLSWLHSWYVGCRISSISQSWASSYSTPIFMCQFISTWTSTGWPCLRLRLTPSFIATWTESNLESTATYSQQTLNFSDSGLDSSMLSDGCRLCILTGPVQTRAFTWKHRTSAGTSLSEVKACKFTSDWYLKQKIESNIITLAQTGFDNFVSILYIFHNVFRPILFILMPKYTDFQKFIKKSINNINTVRN